MARPQGRHSLNVSCLTQSQCLAVSMSPQVSGLRSLVSPHHSFTPRALGGAAWKAAFPVSPRRSYRDPSNGR
jgi:hypothetical protein